FVIRGSGVRIPSPAPARAHSRDNGRRALVEVSGAGFIKSEKCSALRGNGGVSASNRRLELLGSNQRDPNTERKGVPVLAGACGTSYGQVAEWSKAADCKSADPCGLRRFEPSPVHQKDSDE